jgi:hypothetical protein
MKDYKYEASLITKEGVDALLKFLPYFCNKRSRFGTQSKNIDMTVIPSTLTKKANDFYEACYEHKFVQNFDWGKWSQSQQSLVHNGVGIESLDLTDIGRLLMTHIRGDRFCDGHLLAVMRSGQIARILERLAVLRENQT